MIELKTPAEIHRMHVAGRFVAEVLSEVGQLADVGVNLLDLEHHVRGMIKRRGAESCYWDYAPSFGRGPFRNGICRTMHEDLHVPNKGRAGRGLKLRPGLTLALEPWFARTTDQIVYDADGWTIRSADGSRTAHSEHTVAITDDGPLVLTRREPERPATRSGP